MPWTGFHLNPEAWATATVNAPTLVSTSAPSNWIKFANPPTGRLRIQFVGQGADDSVTGIIGIYAISTDDFYKPTVYMAQLWYIIATEVVFSTAALETAPNFFRREGTIRWADAITGGAATNTLSAAFDAAMGADTTDFGTFAGANTPAELVFGNASGLHGLAFSVTFSTATAFNILINYEY